MRGECAINVVAPRENAIGNGKIKCRWGMVVKENILLRGNKYEVLFLSSFLLHCKWGCCGGNAFMKYNNVGHEVKYMEYIFSSSSFLLSSFACMGKMVYRKDWRSPRTPVRVKIFADVDNDVGKRLCDHRGKRYAKRETQTKTNGTMRRPAKYAKT